MQNHNQCCDRCAMKTQLGENYGGKFYCESCTNYRLILDRIDKMELRFARILSSFRNQILSTTSPEKVTTS